MPMKIGRAGSFIFSVFLSAFQAAGAAPPRLNVHADFLLSARLQMEKESPVDGLFKRLVSNGDETAIPELRAAFETSDDDRDKQVIASVLLSERIYDKRYYELLVEHAKPAIESDCPFPILRDDNGKLLKGKYTQDFLAWAASKHLDPHAAAERTLYEDPTEVRMLAAAGVRDANSLLLAGLKSPNSFVVAISAKGLAKDQDLDAVQPIVEACEKASPADAELIAKALVYFPTEGAQKAAERFIPNPILLNSLREKAKREGTRGLFGY
jgi:hypothetical protein